MAEVVVAVGAYSSYRPASMDWDQLEVEPVATNLVDAAMIEWGGDLVAALRCSLRRHGWGYGAVASAVVAALWPPALLTGAIAGGVGDRVLAWFSREISADAAGQLGAVLRRGPIDLVVVSTDPSVVQIVGTLGQNSIGLAATSLSGNSDELLAAARLDAIGAFEP